MNLKYVISFSSGGDGFASLMTLVNPGKTTGTFSLNFMFTIIGPPDIIDQLGDLELQVEIPTSGSFQTFYLCENAAGGNRSTVQKVRVDANTARYSLICTLPLRRSDDQSFVTNIYQFGVVGSASLQSMGVSIAPGSLLRVEFIDDNDCGMQ